MKYFSEDHKEIQSGKKLDNEGYHVMVEMDKIEQSLEKLRKIIKKSGQKLPAWVQSKIIKSSDYLDIAADYLASDVEMSENISFNINKEKHKKAKSGAEKTEKIKELIQSPNPNEAEVAKRKLSSRETQLPVIKEESLVDKILSEMMGDKPGCDTKKSKPLDKIAKKHKVSVESLEKQLKKGTKIEMEHTTDRGEAETIALHHLEEIPDYYSRLVKMEGEAEVKEDLRDWLGKGKEGGVGGGGWDRYNSEGKRAGKCGDAEEGDTYSTCLSKEKADKLGEKGVASFVRRKRKAQDEAGYDEKGEGPKGRKPVFVKTKVNEDLEILEEKNEPTNPELWSKAKSLAKQKFDVYPSAYANAWAAKWYKEKGGSWKSIDEATTRLPMQTGQLLRVLVNWRGKHISVQMFFPQLGTPKRDEITYAVNKIYPESRVISYVPCSMDSSAPIIQVKEEKEGGDSSKKPLNKPMRTPGERKKFKVYVRNSQGNIVTVRFGDPNMEIKRDDPDRLAAFRARHNCADAKDKTTPKYWSCYQWRAGKKVED